MSYTPATHTIEIPLDQYPDPDSGTLDSDLEVDRQQNLGLTAWSLHHAPHLQNISSKCVHNFMRFAAKCQFTPYLAVKNPGK